MSDMKKRELFGGAMTMQVPSDYIDASDLRHVPDGQEIFIDVRSDRSVIVEVLERVPTADDNSARFIFQDLAEVNSSFETSVEQSQELSSSELPNIDPSLPKHLCVGLQRISKYKETIEASNQVRICLCVIRLPQYEADIVITLNDPVFISETSSSASNVPAGPTGVTLADSLALLRRMISTLDMTHVGNLFQSE
eukprot:GILI01012029.1.p1 GENE.GILI01012029.1~~GILI01012029.1.p1  ORF type:complete len:195 (+),score=24.81 GILI01012029.1:100-684(+)